MKNGRIRLTEAVLESLHYPDVGQVFKRDAVDIGLAVRLTSGSKTFVFESMAKGRMHRIKLGRWDDGSTKLAVARRRARDYKAAIGRGEDPFAEREKERQAERKALTFGELREKFIADHARPHCRSWARMEDRLKKHFGRWENYRLEDVTPSAVAKAHARIKAEHGPVEANRAVQLLRAVFNKGIAWNDLDGRNPVSRHAVSWFQEDPEVNVLSLEECRRVMCEIQDEPDWRWQAYFKLLMLIPLRRSELIAAKWADVSFERGELTLPRANTKTGKTRTIRLTRIPAMILEGLPSMANKSGFLFPGTGRTGHLVEPTAAWERIRARAGVRHVTIHDMRRTVATLMEREQNVSLSTIQELLGHRRITTTQRYLKPGDEAQRRALERHAALIG